MLVAAKVECVLHTVAKADVPLAGHVQTSLGLSQLCTIWDGQVFPLGAPAGTADAVVSYSGLVRGRVEDQAHDIACSVTSFSLLPALLSGARLVATVPDRVALSLGRVNPWLMHAAVPDAAPQELALTCRVLDAESRALKWLIAVAQKSRRE
jgi:hypothetical protein